MDVMAVEVMPLIGAGPQRQEALADGMAVGGGGTLVLADRFGLEARALVHPDLGDRGWKPIVDQLVGSPVTGPAYRWNSLGSASFAFTPIDGAVGERTFAVRLSLGTGLVRTRDDLKRLQAEDEPTAVATEREWHATLDLGGALRVALSDRVSAELAVHHARWVETIDGTDLEAAGLWLVTLSPVLHLRTLE